MVLHQRIGLPRPMAQPATASDFDAIHALERATIRTLDPVPAHAERPQTGLAFSGGGIRSATFNLGMLQALSELKLLREFDYLSCVSGGGYIGGWLSAFIHRECSGKVELAERKLKTGGVENSAIRYLRSYSNYLTPQAGFFSADTLTAVSTYLRNLYLNLTLLVLALGGMLLLPRLLVWLVRWLAGWNNLSSADDRIWPLFVGGIGCTVIAMLFAGMNLGCRHRGKRTPHWYTGQRWILVLIVVPGLLSAWLLSYGFYVGTARLVNISPGAWMIWGVLVYVLPWGIGWSLGQGLERRRTAPFKDPALSLRRLLCMGVFAVLAGCVGGALMVGFAQITASIPRGIHNPMGYVGSWIASALATALLIKFYSLTVISHIGLMGRFFSHDSREWWSRLGGWMLLFSLIWALVFSIVFLAPAFFRWAPQWFVSSGALAWVAATAIGVLLGRHPATSGDTRNTGREWAAKVMPYIFIVGLFGLLSFGVHQLLLVLPCSERVHLLFGGQCGRYPGATGTGFLSVVANEARYFQEAPIGLVAALCVSSLAAAAALAWRFDVNLFSIYYFYRQRLTRCYLGASRCKARTPHPFTGFDPQDDLKLAELYHEENGHIVCQRPYPIFNTAMNLVAGKQLAWQERLAAAFSFSPLACGYSFTLPDEKGLCLSHYRPTAQYMEGAWLGSAMAISGAAASPNMGYHSSPAVTFLMTVFNVRLGHWSGNPAHPQAWAIHDPAFGGTYLLKELFGLTDYTSPFVYLSDGGHFENLGVYELVRRRVLTIVVIDAGQDKLSTFDDLGNAIRKCYADFGVVIDVHADALKNGYHAVGRILYPPEEGETAPTPEGTLIYIKPALTGIEPADLQNYGLTHPGFPHQPTTDQCFDESQFESYRKLGHWIGKHVFETPLLNAQERLGSGKNALAGVSALMRESAGLPPDSQVKSSSLETIQSA